MLQVEDETPLLDPKIPLSEFPSALTQIAIDCVWELGTQTYPDCFHPAVEHLLFRNTEQTTRLQTQLWVAPSTYK